MARVSCSMCKATLDSRSMQTCPTCYEYLCPECASANHGQCRACLEEDDLPE